MNHELHVSRFVAMLILTATGFALAGHPSWEQPELPQST
jgi:hypothetical protein